MLAILLPLLQASAQNPDATQVMMKCRDLSITGSMTGKMNLIITEKNGSIRNRTLSMTSKSYEGGLEKRLIRFLEPADVRGTAMLIIDNRDIPDEMWIYLPALKKTRRIVTSEKGKNFMSSEFSNADMSSPALSDFSFKYINTDRSGDQWVIESIPASDDKADEYGFSRRISYIDKDSYQTKKMEFYGFDNHLFKVIEIRDVILLRDGKYMIRDMAASNLLNGRKSEIVFSYLSEGTDIDDSVFTLRNLER
jgi:outer membrane lipoprotein-sorting protein